MLNIYICEDELNQREALVKSVDKAIKEEELRFTVVCDTDNPYKILELVRKDDNECIFFLDIDLGQEMNGIELSSELRKIKPRCFIIFVTTHSEMSYLTFNYRVEAMDFIIKDNYRDMDSRVKNCLLNCDCLSNQNPEDDEKTFSVKLGDKIKMVPVDNILYFEVSEASRKILLHGENCEIEFAGNMKDVESKLDEQFYRCHRSFIINKEKISSVDYNKNQVILSNGSECPMSIRLKSGLRYFEKKSV
ncbi:two component transcriptional regulator, LytTR family [Pseudobutyrivibrio sp. YE44]|uniref:LytR/AlgR family response regulator transcription factor n=1 Tax=Pseudobutyrivibrio sp. YE44 TaxID=1520802 RepID=UPI000890B9D9|nr:LytTR family DNA-binding domain-containing protein [Pseudobutyrivibrio sp. YE44]SDB23602.1 two component transcriptional regulator, LytTR family [Pseudobutyrivibrio sp. YE44]